MTNLDERYPPHSPHRALAEWLDSWATTDWERLAMATQPSWRLARPNHLALLTGAYAHLIMERYSIPSKRLIAPVTRVDGPTVGPAGFIVFTDLKCRVSFTVLDEHRHYVKDVVTVITARLVREHSDGTAAERADKTGAWYVNPVSMTRGDPVRTRTTVAKRVDSVA